MTFELPNYRIIEKLGIGAESHIYRARCMRTGKDYAVKIVKLVKPEDANYIELLRSEYAIGSAVHHPVVRKVYELRMIRQRLRLRGAVLFLEYVDGIAMSDREFKELNPTLDEVLRMFGEVANGLHAMHVAGYVHADLKPQNLMINSLGHVKLIDLGQSARIHMAKNRVQGTIDYIAPEQAQKGVLDQRTDVFGLGAALYRVLTGKVMPTEMNQTVSMHSQNLVGRRLADIRESAITELPTCVGRLIDDCCKPKMEDRIPDMVALAERFRLARTVLSAQSLSVPVDADFMEEEDEEPGSADEALFQALEGEVDLEQFDPADFETRR